MRFGLTDKQFKVIKQIMLKHPEIESAMIFGSRALGTFKAASDVDLALKGHLSFELLAKIKAELEESSLPYFFDVVDYHTLQNPQITQHIDQYGKLFYQRVCD